VCWITKAAETYLEYVIILISTATEVSPNRLNFTYICAVPVLLLNTTVPMA
jgi:hypothetical protein